MRELVYCVAVSLDGYIAGPDGQFDAFPVEGDHIDHILRHFPDTVPTDFAGGLGIDQSTGRFGTVLMGWNTYDVGRLASPYRHLNQIVFSRRHQAEGEHLTVTRDDPAKTVRDLKSQPGKDIWLCGGAALATSLLPEIDRLVLKHNPVLLGGGIPLFQPGAYEPRRVVHRSVEGWRSATVRKPALPIEESGVFDDRAELR